VTSRLLGYGIDFGTSNSAVAIAYDDRVEVVPLGSSRTLPSFVYLHRAGRRAAGEDAVRTFLKSGHEKTDCWNCSLAPYGWDTDCRQYRKGGGCNDARLLSLYLSKGLLPEVRMKDKEHGQLASLTQTRDTLVKLRTALKNKVNNVCSAHGVNLHKESLASEKGLRAVLEMPFDGLVNLELKIIIDQIRSLNKSIAELEEAIGTEGQKLEGHRNLTSIKGIGRLSGGILLSIIGDIGDFADEGKLAAYFGIVPRVSNSNETEHSGRITKRGTKLGRTTLIQCALIAQRYSPYLKTYYEKMKSRRGTGKAIVALARKFLGVIYRTLKNKWVFEDFPNFVLAEEQTA